MSSFSVFFWGFLRFLNRHKPFKASPSPLISSLHHRASSFTRQKKNKVSKLFLNVICTVLLQQARWLAGRSRTAAAACSILSPLAEATPFLHEQETNTSRIFCGKHLTWSSYSDPAWLVNRITWGKDRFLVNILKLTALRFYCVLCISNPHKTKFRIKKNVQFSPSFPFLNPEQGLFKCMRKMIAYVMWRGLCQLLCEFKMVVIWKVNGICEPRSVFCTDFDIILRLFPSSLDSAKVACWVSVCVCSSVIIVSQAKW